MADVEGEKPNVTDVEGENPNVTDAEGEEKTIGAIVYKTYKNDPLNVKRHGRYWEPLDTNIKDFTYVEIGKITLRMFDAIYNSSFKEFKELFELKYSESTKGYSGDSLIKIAVETPISDLKPGINVEKTFKNLGIDANDKHTPREYILKRLEQIQSTYKSTDESQKANIKALWDMLTYSTSDDPSFKGSEFIKKSQYFQPFLRKIMGKYESIDEVIGVDAKKKYVDTYLDKKISERISSFASGLSFGKKDTAPTTGASTTKRWNPFSGGRKSRKQRKSKKQQKSRKHGKKSRSRK